VYVCVCYAVTDREICAEINAGARSEEEIGLRCGAGTGCGYCIERICDLLRAVDPTRSTTSRALTPDPEGCTADLQLADRRHRGSPASR
jgi:bacterioferritin-associated ferredoxin